MIDHRGDRPDVVGVEVPLSGDGPLAIAAGGGPESPPPTNFVTLDDGNSVARAFTVEIPGALVPEWQLYALGPTSEFVPSDRPTRLTYTVYVDQHNEIRRVVGISDLGGIPQLVVHDIETLAQPILIDTPEPEVAPEADPPPRSG